ncbi:hypothetical protein [Paenibacillus sp. NPDC058174]|uniref:hypothetical protein n=1 Tax=Paenibacillus sp. NPDC058174 TaxID=3346366 RepID=UPI0036DAFF4A
MGTRLWMEHVIKQRFPHVRYIRIHSTGSHKAVIYAWDEHLSLSEKDTSDLLRFASDHLPQDVCFTVKPYSYAVEDGIAPIEVPERLRKAAMNGSLDQAGVFAELNGLFTGVVVAYRRYDLRTGTVHLDAYSCASIEEQARSVIQSYVNELMPVGSTARVFFYGT